MEEKNNKEREIVSSLGMPVDPKKEPAGDFSVPQLSGSQKAVQTKKNKKDLAAAPGGEATYKMSPAEKGKQTRSIKDVNKGDFTFNVKNEQPMEKAAAETFPKSEEEMGVEKNVEYNKFRKNEIEKIRDAVLKSGGDWDKRAINMAEKTVLDRFNKQQAAKETANIAKSENVKEALEVGKETMSAPESPNETLSEEQNRYNRAKELLASPDIDKDSAAYFNAQKIVGDYEHEEDINKLMSENEGMDRNTAESFLAKQKKEKEDAAEIEQLRNVRENRRNQFQEIFNSQPEGVMKDYARNELARMEQEDKVREFLISSGIPENSPMFRRAERQAMADYQKMLQLEKAQRKEEAAALSKKKLQQSENLKRIISLASPWAKLVTTILVYGLFLG